VKALVYRGAKQVAVEDVPDAKVQEPSDAVIRLTTSNICGSDLHMYEGRTSVEAPATLAASELDHRRPAGHRPGHARHSVPPLRDNSLVLLP